MNDAVNCIRSPGALLAGIAGLVQKLFEQTLYAGETERMLHTDSIAS
jgi:hypothetical protein